MTNKNWLAMDGRPTLKTPTRRRKERTHLSEDPSGGVDGAVGGLLEGPLREADDPHAVVHAARP